MLRSSVDPHPAVLTQLTHIDAAFGFVINSQDFSLLSSIISESYVLMTVSLASEKPSPTLEEMCLEFSRYERGLGPQKERRKKKLQEGDCLFFPFQCKSRNFVNKVKISRFRSKCREKSRNFEIQDESLCALALFTMGNISPPATTLVTDEIIQSRPVIMNNCEHWQLAEVVACGLT